MRNNRDRRGRPTFFEELTPLANAIGSLPPAQTGGQATYSGKLGKAQAKRERRAERNLARSSP